MKEYVNDELEKMWKRLWLNFKLLSRHLPEGIEENNEKPARIVVLQVEI
jgi:hypothetical protein